MNDEQMRDATCVVGVGTSRYGNFPDTDDYGLGVEALKEALEDAGLSVGDLDGLIVGRIRSYETFSEMIGMNRQKLNLQLNSAGRFSAISVMTAAQALVTGQAKCIALVYGNNGRSVRDTYGGAPGLYSPWGFTSPGARHALMARRHMDLYGTTSEQFGHVGMTFRRHASLNPYAVKREPFTIEEHQVMGGVGSAVAEVLAQNYPVPMKLIGLNSFGQSGTPAELIEHYGLHPAGIAESVRKFAC